MRAAMLGVVFTLLFGSSTATAGLVVNGGFETGDFSGWTFTDEAPGYYGITDVMPHSGAYAAWFGDPFGLMFISQVIPTVPGEAYEASFWIANYNGGELAENEGQVFWDGTLVAEGRDVGDMPWRFVEGTFIATGDMTTLEFGFYNVPGWWNLDDVRVEAIPEPGTMALCGAALGLLAMCGKHRCGRHT